MTTAEAWPACRSACCRASHATAGARLCHNRQVMGSVLVAFAEAMKAVAGQFPEDVDVQAMTAEAMMNIHAWKQ